MDISIYQKIKSNPKLYELLKYNSHYLKSLNRDPNTYTSFVSQMKEKYKLRATDKINEVIDNIDLISNILDTLK